MTNQTSKNEPDKIFTQKRVAILSTGGTIAGNVAASKVSQSVKSDGYSFLTSLEESLKIIKKNWNIEIKPTVKDIVNVDSSNMLPENWTAIIDAITKMYDDFDAFIVLHGTNTMGYTAAALSFAFENIKKPVILTGAQVPLGYLGTDATTNLVNSLRMAVWGYHEVKGVMAVFGSKVITGTRVKKGTDFAYDPFSSFLTGSLATIGRYIRINEPNLRKHVAYLSKSKPLAIQSRVLSVKKEFNTRQIVSLTEHAGLSPDVFKTLVEQNNIKGFVFRAFGAGDASSHLVPALKYLKKKKIPIVITSQAPGGNANFLVNEPGQYIKEHDLAIPAHDMSIESMTTKLAWLLAQNLNYDEIKLNMLKDLHGEINVEAELI